MHKQSVSDVDFLIFHLNTGMETAEMIAKQSDVTAISLVDMVPQIGAGIYYTILANIMRNLEEANAKLCPGHMLKAIDDKGVHLTKVEDQSETFLEADCVILAMGLKPDQEFIRTFDERFDRVHVLGECNVAPGKIANAVSDGYITAYGFNPEA